MHMTQPSYARAKDFKKCSQLLQVESDGASRSDSATYALAANNHQYGVQANPYGMNITSYDYDYEEVGLGPAEVASKSPNWSLIAKTEPP